MFWDCDAIKCVDMVNVGTPCFKWCPNGKFRLNIIFVPMDFPIKPDTVMSGCSIVCIEGSQVIISPKILYFFSED